MAEQIEMNRTPLLLAMGVGGLLALLVALHPSFQAGIASLAVGVTAVAIFNRHVALYLIPPAVALTPEIPVLGIPVRIEDLLMVPLAAGWLAHLCVFKDHQRTPLDRLLIAYLLVGVIATAWGGYLGTAHLSLTSKDYSAPFHLLKRLELVLLFFIVSDTLTTARQVQRFTYVLMASMIGLSGFGLGSYLANHTIAVGPADPGHETGLASMVNVALALSLVSAARPPAKLLLSAIILFSVAVLPPTLGRNYIATTAIVMLYVGVFHKRWVLLLFPILWFFGLHLYPPEVVEHVLTLQNVFAPPGEGTGASVFSRVLPPAYFGLFGLGYSPVLGFGLASLPLGTFDSEYATQLFYTGLVGLAIFFMLGARLFRLTGEVARAARNQLDAAVAKGVHLVLIAYVAHSIFSPSISASRVGAVFFFAAGLLVVLHRSLTPMGESPMNRASGATQGA